MPKGVIRNSYTGLSIDSGFEDANVVGRERAKNRSANKDAPVK